MSMLLTAALLLALVVTVLLLALARRHGTSRPVDYPYTLSKALFSPAERSFLAVLDQAVPPDYRVFGKVRLADVISPRKGLNSSQWYTALNRITSKHFDFVVCRATDLAVVCAIELDDSSHQREKRKTRDEFVANACQAVGLPLLRISTRRGYAVADIRAQFLSAVGATPPPDEDGSAQPAAALEPATRAATPEAPARSRYSAAPAPSPSPARPARRPGRSAG